VAYLFDSDNGKNTVIRNNKIRHLTSLPPRIFFTFIGFLVIAAMMLTSCDSGGGIAANGPNGNNGKGCTQVGVLLPDTTSSTRWEKEDHPLLIKAIKAAIPNVHIDYNNAQGNTDTQFSQAQADLARGDCILVVSPHDSVAAAAIVAQAKARNVPVIAYDRMIESKDTNYYVSFDGVAVGELQGRYIAEHYQQYVTPGNANTVVINGSQTDSNGLLFSEGLHDALDPLFADGILKSTFEYFTPDWNDASAQTEMEVALNKLHNNVQIAYVANDGMADSVITALKAVHLSGKVLVTGQDATVQGIHHILVGDQNMTVYKPIAKEAQSVGDLVKAIYSGNQASINAQTKGVTTPTADGGNIPSVLDTPIAVDKSNIASTVIADGFVTKSEVCQGIPAGTDGVC
jgi:D-xylose transport system substrate-binding protein